MQGDGRQGCLKLTNIEAAGVWVPSEKKPPTSKGYVLNIKAAPAPTIFWLALRCLFLFMSAALIFNAKVSLLKIQMTHLGLIQKASKFRYVPGATPGENLFAMLS
jgi:hypothetical protein